MLLGFRRGVLLLMACATSGRHVDIAWAQADADGSSSLGVRASEQTQHPLSMRCRNNEDARGAAVVVPLLVARRIFAQLRCQMAGDVVRCLGFLQLGAVKAQVLVAEAGPFEDTGDLLVELVEVSLVHLFEAGHPDAGPAVATQRFIAHPVDCIARRVLFRAATARDLHLHRLALLIFMRTLDLPPRLPRRFWRSVPRRRQEVVHNRLVAEDLVAPPPLENVLAQSAFLENQGPLLACPLQFSVWKLAR